MNTKFIKILKRLLFVLVFGSFATVYFSCQKAEPDPYSVPSTGTLTYAFVTNPPDTAPSFKASVNNSSVISFTPGKNIIGSNTNLIGSSTYYTITIKFPNTTGPGNYNIGVGGNVTAMLVNGSTTYVVNNTYGAGNMKIDSISSLNKYYGTFSLIGVDTTNFSNTVNVTQGSFYHL